MNCKTCHLDDIKHKRKQMCTSCYCLYRKASWIAKDELRKEHIGFVEKRKAYKALYFKTNKDKIRVVHSTYEKNRLSNDLSFYLRKTLRRRFTEAFKNNAKTGSAVSDLGCSIEHLKTYLESLFQLGMTWTNHDVKGWHIDHIKPLSSFDLSDLEQVKKACHYTNLQPLWAKDNLLKGHR